VKADKHPDYQASYDAVAEEYVRRIAGELEHKPLDRELLDRLNPPMEFRQADI
jgi:hypothetical protein